MKNHCRINYLVLFIIGFVIIFLGGWQCSNGIADGGSEAGNAYIIGKIVDGQGNSLANTLVALIPQEYNPVSNNALPDSLLDTTDDCGNYSFTVKNTGFFNIQAIHMTQRTRLFIPEIIPAKDTTIIDQRVLKNSGYIQVLIPESFDITNGFMYLEGTTFAKSLAEATLLPGNGLSLVFDSIPEAIFPTVMYMNIKEPRFPIPFTEQVSVLADDTTTVGDTLWWINYTRENSGLPVNSIQDVFIESNGTAWFATNGGGMAKFTDNSWIIYDSTTELSTNWIKSIHKKREDTLWIRTDKGVAHFDGTQWYSIPNTFHITLTGIDEDSKRRKWVSTRYLGLISPDGGLSTLNSNLLSNNINGFKISQGDTLWCATGAGIEKLKDDFHHLYYEYGYGLQSYDIFSMHFRRNGDKWFAGKGGVACLRGTKWRVYNNTSSALFQDSVFTICEDNNNHLWFGTAQGITVFDGEQWHDFTGALYSFIENKKISSIAFDSSENIWLGTAHHGVITIKKNRLFFAAHEKKI